MSIIFGNKLKNIRLKNNFTQLEMANKLGITKGTISKWENGKLEPDIEMIKAIAYILNISTDELLNYEPYNYKFEYQHDNTTLIHKEKK